MYATVCFMLLIPILVEDVSLIDESVRGEDEDTLPLWATTDYRVVKNYVAVE